MCSSFKDSCMICYVYVANCWTLNGCYLVRMSYVLMASLTMHYKCIKNIIPVGVKYCVVTKGLASIVKLREAPCQSTQCSLIRSLWPNKVSLSAAMLSFPVQCCSGMPWLLWPVLQDFPTHAHSHWSLSQICPAVFEEKRKYSPSSFLAWPG